LHGAHELVDFGATNRGFLGFHLDAEAGGSKPQHACTSKDVNATVGPLWRSLRSTNIKTSEFLLPVTTHACTEAGGHRAIQRLAGR
jgi:hypothetical protein